MLHLLLAIGLAIATPASGSYPGIATLDASGWKASTMAAISLPVPAGEGVGASAFIGGLDENISITLTGTFK